jgi:RNA polymerase sigma-70 factor, ECF subfamily
MDTSTGSGFVAEDELLQGLVQRNPAAFRAAVEIHSGRMLATARAIAGSADAEDIVQDAWLAVYQKIATFQRRASLGTWIQRIVINRAISHLRSASREVQAPEPSDGDSAGDWFDDAGRWAHPPVAWSAESPEALLSAGALQDCIDKHLALMPANQRSLVIMRDMEGMEFEEICNALGLSSSNARVLLHRGRLRLMNMVNGFQETGSC